MSEAAKRIQADESIAGQPCGWCQAPLGPGAESAICNSCGVAHHGTCWDNQLGCSKADCLNAPLKRMDAAPAGTSSAQAQSGSAKQPPPGFKFCPTCKNPILVESQVCDLCGAITTPDGLYHGPKENAPGAVASLVFAIIGIFICQPVFAPLALVNANKAKSAIRADPRYGGEGLATAGMVIGIIDIVLFVIALAIRLSAASSSRW